MEQLFNKLFNKKRRKSKGSWLEIETYDRFSNYIFVVR